MNTPAFEDQPQAQTRVARNRATLMATRNLFRIDSRASRLGDGAPNALIQADNGLALSRLGTALTGGVRCIYIDPPYNNQESYTHYEDALPHAEWLAEVVPRLSSLWRLLSEDGSLWVSIDDRELHYLKVKLDEICGRSNFVTTIVWEHRVSRENRRVFSCNHEYILVYAKNPKAFHRSRTALPFDETVARRFKNPDADPRGPWQSVSLNVQAGHGTDSQFYTFKAPNGVKYTPPEGRCWALSRQRLADELSKNNIWFGTNGTGVPRMKKFLSNSRKGLTPETLWRAAEVGTTADAKKHLKELFPTERQFDTPKPELLIKRIIEIATQPGDIVLDGYLGSGTSAAAAMKLGRYFLGIEREPEAAKLAARRLAYVVAGEPGGISRATNWCGGSGFAFLRPNR
jgi:adenine-specific DNA-methyltransferase